MNILITGATGMLGKRLVPMLRKDGMDIFMLTNSEIKQNVKQKVFFWDAKKGIFPKNLTQSFDIVIHLAGANVGGQRWTDSYKKEILTSRTDTSMFLLKNLKEQGNLPKTYISASGTDFYPNDSEVIYTEEDAPGSHFLAGVCKSWENVANEWRNAGCITQIIRTPVVLANGEGFLHKMLQTSFLRVIPTTDHPNNKLNWIHADDLCRIYRFAIDLKISGVWNAVAPETITLKQLVKSIDTARQKRTWHPNVPCFALKIMLGEMGTLACGSRQVSSEKLLDSGFRYLFPTLQNALNDIFQTTT
ncbi:MAG: TIGR01777 family oxidoreductase [Sphingomonadales bacterium]|jgi:uncharacterized protein (TIGR01777 family)